MRITKKRKSIVEHQTLVLPGRGSLEHKLTHARPVHVRRLCVAGKGKEQERPLGPCAVELMQHLQ